MPRRTEGGPQFDNDDRKPERKKKGDLTEAQKAQKELNERDRIAKGLENEVFDFGVPEKQEAKDTTVEESKTEAEFSPQPEMSASAESSGEAMSASVKSFGETKPESAEKLAFEEQEQSEEKKEEEKAGEKNEAAPDNQEEPKDNGQEKEPDDIPEDDENLRDLQEGINEILQKSIKGEGAPADNETIRNLFDETEKSLNGRIEELEAEISNLDSGGNEEGDEENENENETDNSEKIAEKEEEIEEIRKSLETLTQRKEAFERSLQTGEAPEQIKQEDSAEDEADLIKQARETDKIRREYIEAMKLKSQIIAENPDFDFSKDLEGKQLETKADEAEKNGDTKEFQRLVGEINQHYKKLDVLDVKGVDLGISPEKETGQLELDKETKQDIKELFGNELGKIDAERDRLKETGEGYLRDEDQDYNRSDLADKEKERIVELGQELDKDKWSEETKVAVLEILNNQNNVLAREILEEGLSDDQVLEKGAQQAKMFDLRKKLYQNLTGENIETLPDVKADEEMDEINRESWEIIKQEAKKESSVSVRQSADSSEAKPASVENSGEARQENTEQKIETKEEQIAEAKNEIKQAFEQEQPEQETQQKANQNSSKRGEAFKNAYKGEMERRQTEKKELEEQSEEIEKAEKQKERGGVIMAYGGLALYGVMRGVAFMVDRMLNLADIADNPGNWVKKRISEWSDKQQKRFDKHVETYFPEPFARKKLDKE